MLLKVKFLSFIFNKEGVIPDSDWIKSIKGKQDTNK